MTQATGDAQLLKLYADAKANDRCIPVYAKSDPHEYFAESFTAALLHTKVLAKRDPAMYAWMNKLLKGKNLLP